MTKKLISSSCLIVSIIGCADQNSIRSPSTQLSHDVYVMNLNPEGSISVKKLAKELHTSCVQHLKKITCISEKDSSEFDEGCSSKNVPQKILSSLNQVFSELPDFHKKVMCHMNRIQIHPKISSIGYAAAIRNEKGLSIGSMIGLKIELLQDSSKQDAKSWKEQLNFGLSDLNDIGRNPNPRGPFVRESVDSLHPQLFTVVVHELNHLIDMFNRVNSTIGECAAIPGEANLGRCQYSAGTFPKLSWGDEVEVFIDEVPADFKYVAPPPSWSKEYPLLSNLCYYWCEGKTISPDLVEQTYQQLYESPFLTPYSVSSEMEDFAESAMVWILSQTNRPISHVIPNGDGVTLFESDRHLKSSAVQPKLKWLSDFFNRPDLKFKFEQ